MIFISKNISLKEDDLTFKAVRASGPGGQHVNATSSAIHLQFDAKACQAISPAMLKRLATEAGRRLSASGVLTLRAESHSSQHRNRDDALARLKSLLLTFTSNLVSLPRIRDMTSLLFFLEKTSVIKTY